MFCRVARCFRRPAVCSGFFSDIAAIKIWNAVEKSDIVRRVALWRLVRSFNLDSSSESHSYEGNSVAMLIYEFAQILSLTRLGRWAASGAEARIGGGKGSGVADCNPPEQLAF